MIRCGTAMSNCFSNSFKLSQFIKITSIDDPDAKESIPTCSRRQTELQNLYSVTAQWCMYSCRPKPWANYSFLSRCLRSSRLLASLFDNACVWQTDGQTDRQTDKRNCSNIRAIAYMLSRVKCKKKLVTIWYSVKHMFQLLSVSSPWEKLLRMC